MSGPLMVSRAALLAALASCQREDQAVGLALEAVAAENEEELLLAAVDRRNLLEIYERRLSPRRQSPDGLVGTDRLLDDFRASTTEALLALTLERGGRVTTVWFDNDGHHVVGIVSGLDKRSR